MSVQARLCHQVSFDAKSKEKTYFFWELLDLGIMDHSWAPQVARWVKNTPVMWETQADTSLSPKRGKTPGGGHGNPLQCSCLENPMERAAWWATVHGVTESDMTEGTEHARVQRPQFVSRPDPHLTRKETKGHVWTAALTLFL